MLLQLLWKNCISRACITTILSLEKFHPQHLQKKKGNGKRWKTRNFSWKLWIHPTPTYSQDSNLNKQHGIKCEGSVGVQAEFGMDKLPLLDWETKRTNSRIWTIKGHEQPWLLQCVQLRHLAGRGKALTFHLCLYRTQLHRPNYYREGKRNFTF